MQILRKQVTKIIKLIETQPLKTLVRRKKVRSPNDNKYLDHKLLTEYTLRLYLPQLQVRCRLFLA